METSPVHSLRYTASPSTNMRAPKAIHQTGMQGLSVKREEQALTNDALETERAELMERLRAIDGLRLEQASAGVTPTSRAGADSV